MTDLSGMQFPPNLQGVPIPWFSQAEWLLAREYMEDAHTFHDTYGEFVARVESAERQLRGRGIATVRVPIVKDQFQAWCVATGRKVDRDSREIYVALIAAQQERAGRRK